MEVGIIQDLSTILTHNYSSLKKRVQIKLMLKLDKEIIKRKSLVENNSTG